MKHWVLILLLSALPCSGNVVDYDALVKAVTAVESGGNPLTEGLAGERGLMQIKPGTWRDMTRLRYGRDLPFDYAFHSRLNQQMGRAYLEYIANRLVTRPGGAGQDMLPVMVASYNLGPNAVARRGYRLERLPRHARVYVDRVLNLYEVYRADTLSPTAVDSEPALLAAAIADGPRFAAGSQDDSIFADRILLQPHPPAARVKTASPLMLIAPIGLERGVAALLPLLLVVLACAAYRRYRQVRHSKAWLSDMAGPNPDPRVQEFDFVRNTLRPEGL